MTKDAYYFPHFYNARHDRKIRRVRKELGPEGYGLYFMLLEVLREQTDFSYPLDDIDLLADEFGSSEQKVRTVISNYDLFMVTDKQFFFSQTMINHLQPYLEKSQRAKLAAEKRWSNHRKAIGKDANALPEHSKCNADQNAIRREEIIIDKNKYNPADFLSFFNDIDFQEIWKDYISVRTKKKAAKSDRAIKSIVTKLLDYSSGNKQIAIEILSKSADSGWTDIYQPKEAEKTDREKIHEMYLEKQKEHEQKELIV